ncbi:pimeloyl-ACP methyl ester carboxylesterase [Paucibacter oligotrophus]|uniref:Pimeloyl-ACP methyl ester carboxylesterase n=1 Tax=Roseateles oligotrophus TaxID=1769250 RepID=A0A840L2X5_9BURK|nr:alpha/beta hydrolase [Roseateles oligotrophus]MBB4842181.1 pimeloyl-ACP methyl ester carboxylesterase [Roseateles oligotrophus]
MNSPTPYLPRRSHRSQFISLRGLRHHLLRWGEDVPSSADRPLLVLLHGWMDVGASFQFMVDALSRQRPIVALDWRGFGLSERSPADSYWFPDYLGDLDALLDQLSPGAPVDLLGHSMGGNVVMSYAGLRPQRIRRLINLEGFGLPDAAPEQAPERLIAWLDELKAPPQLKPYDSLQAVAQRLIKTNPRLTPDKAGWLAPHWSHQVTRPDGGLEWQILADPAHKQSNPVLYRRAEVLACWARIAAPTLWVEGRDTAVLRWFGDRYPRADFEERIARVPQLRREVLAQAGHMLHHDQPEALARILEDFLGA